MVTWNAGGSTYIVYLFSEVADIASLGHIQATDQVMAFVFTGFRPAWSNDKKNKVVLTHGDCNG